MKKEKLFNIVGQAVLYVAFCASCTAVLAFGFLQNSIF